MLLSWHCLYIAYTLYSWHWIREQYYNETINVYEGYVNETFCGYEIEKIKSADPIIVIDEIDTLTIVLIVFGVFIFVIIGIVTITLLIKKYKRVTKPVVSEYEMM